MTTILILEVLDSPWLALGTDRLFNFPNQHIRIDDQYLEKTRPGQKMGESGDQGNEREHKTNLRTHFSGGTASKLAQVSSRRIELDEILDKKRAPSARRRKRCPLAVDPAPTPSPSDIAFLGKES